MVGGWRAAFVFVSRATTATERERPINAANDIQGENRQRKGAETWRWVLVEGCCGATIHVEDMGRNMK